MKYMGSKARIAKHILPIILKNRKDDQCYVEPFVGGANMIDKVDGWRIGADSNYWVIKALRLIQDGLIPSCESEFSERDYNSCIAHVKNKNPVLMGFCDGLIGYALIAFSFGAKWCGGWSRGRASGGENRDYVAEQYRASIKQRGKIKDVEFYNKNYDSLYIPPGSLIYCDPPYAGTTKYKDDFDHEVFWQWCRDKAKEGHEVFISEYNAPDDFVCVWQKEIQSGLNTNTTKKGIEKLFIHKSQS